MDSTQRIIEEMRAEGEGARGVFYENYGLEVRVVGGNHARVWVGDEYTTVPRHKEIPNRFARKILKQIGVK